MEVNGIKNNVESRISKVELRNPGFLGSGYMGVWVFVQEGILRGVHWDKG